MTSKSIHIISSYTVSKFRRFFETQWGFKHPSSLPSPSKVTSCKFATYWFKCFKNFGGGGVHLHSYTPLATPMFAIGGSSNSVTFVVNLFLYNLNLAVGYNKSTTNRTNGV